MTYKTQLFFRFIIFPIIGFLSLVFYSLKMSKHLNNIKDDNVLYIKEVKRIKSRILFFATIYVSLMVLQCIIREN